MPKKIEVLGREVRLTGVNDQDYVCLTDIDRHKNADASDDLIRNWLRNRNTLEVLGLWEQINNPGFNPIEFDGIRMRWWARRRVESPESGGLHRGDGSRYCAGYVVS